MLPQCHLLGTCPHAQPGPPQQGPHTRPGTQHVHPTDTTVQIGATSPVITHHPYCW